jgi:glycosyltransferase involved in cell wall biosynthesis
MVSGGLRTKGITKQSQPDMPLITVVTVVRNGEKTLEQTILSVINQTYRNVEYIVVDGASTDGTLDIIRTYEDRIDYWMSEPDGGIYYAMNKGIDLAAGEWINFMNSGDWFTEKDIVETIFLNAVYTDVDVIYGDSTEKDGMKYTEMPVKKNIHGLNEGPIYRHNASFVRTGTHLNYKFNVQKKSLLEYSLDFECIYRLYTDGKKFLYVKKNIVVWDAEGVSNNTLKNIKYCYLITKKNFSLFKWIIFKLRQIKYKYI